MKSIALSVPGPTPDPNKMDELAGEEVRNARELLKAEVVRDAYLSKPVGPFTNFERLFS